ncbi:sugar phosphate isomerase/epimerase family protein [Salinimicrobium marinum]|nr:sugar phosphate isomerase/epimerase [Salinimicrobium marinum]
MKKVFSIILSVLMTQAVFAQQNSTAKDLDWKLGVQAYTFKNFTFTEALEKIKSIDLNYVEAFPGQTIGNGIEGTMHYEMEANTRQQVKQLLESKGIELVAYGVVSGKNEQDWRNLFEFAKEMGVKVINSEPAQEDLDLVNKLAGEYGVTVGLHNHPKPSTYWHPDTVLEAMKGRENIRACADVGHWIRSGMNPVENLKKLEGHIASVHFKDLNENSSEAHDVPWGTGISDVQAMVNELKRQDFEGVISVEYEHNWDSSLPEIEKSVNYFKRISE